MEAQRGLPALSADVDGAERLMPLLPDDPAMRRTTLVQLIGFIGLPVVCIVGLLVVLLLRG